MGHYYRVTAWNENFETADTRKREKLLWVPVPNKQDGLGYKRIAKHERSCEILAAWLLIVQVASKGEQPPKNGPATINDRGNLVRDNIPLDAADLALMTEFPEEAFEIAIEVLSSPRIKWIERVDLSEPSDAGRSASDAEGSAERGLTEPTERMEGRKGKKEGNPPHSPPSGGRDDSSNSPLSPEEFDTAAKKIEEADRWGRRLGDVWREVKVGRTRHDQIVALLHEQVESDGIDEVESRLRRYLSDVKGNFCTIKRFAETYGDWARTEETERSALDVIAETKRKMGATG